MKNIYPKISILSPTTIFVILGLLLLLGVIVFHQLINQGLGRGLGELPYSVTPIAAAETSTSVPDSLINEIISSEDNMADLSTQCSSRPSLVSQLICQSQQSEIFITQE